MASDSTSITPADAVPPPALDAGPPPSVPPLTTPAADPAGPALVGLLLVLAFATAVVPIRNSDFFQHLALGRGLFEGQLPLGTDALTRPGGVVTWAQHSWLFDAVVFALYSLGGAALVLLVKAGLTVLVVEQQRRVATVPGAQAAPMVLCLLLGLIVLAPHLLVQSRFASVVLLGTTVYLLSRYHTRATKVPPFWALPLVCLLWGNLDHWFFLGPLCVGLYFGGLALEEALRPNERTPAPLGGLFAACLAASFLNPGLFALSWSLPPELGLNGSLAAVADLPGYRDLSASPLGAAYFGPTTGWSVAGQGYFALLLLALASFPLLGGRLACGGAFLVLGLGLLSLYRVAAIPFFAVAAAPWLARNVQELLAIQAAQAPAGKKADATGGVLLTGLALVLAGVAAVAGWLGPWPWTANRLGIGLVTDAGLRDMAERTAELAGWYRDKAGEDLPTWLNTSPAAAHYIAWFAPGQRTYIDQRLALSPDAAADYRAMVRSPYQRFEQIFVRQDPQGDPYEPLRRRGVRFLVYHQADLVEALREADGLPRGTSDEVALARLPLLDPLSQLSLDWPVVHLRGATSTFAFRDPADARWNSFFNDQLVRVAARAFGDPAATAPGEGPTQEPEPPAWLATLWNPEPLRNLDAEEAAQFRLLYQASKLPQRLRVLQAWEGIMIAATWGHSLPLPSVPAGQIAATATILQPWLHRAEPQPTPLAVSFFNDKDVGSPSSAYLQLRAARRSLRDNPLDAQAHLLLAEAYFALSHETREAYRGRGFDHLRQVRHYQVIAAAQAAVRLNPNLERARRLLAQTYREVGAFDLWFENAREAAALHRTAGPFFGEAQDKAEARWKGESDFLDAFDKQVKGWTNRFVTQTARMKALQKAQAALSQQTDNGDPFSLVKEALDLLRALPAEDLVEPVGGEVFGPRLLVETLFLAGDLGQVRGLLQPENANLFGPHPTFALPAFDWYRLCLAACHGDYDDADAILINLLTNLAKDPGAGKAREESGRWFAAACGTFAAASSAGLPPQAMAWVGTRPVDLYLLSQQLALASAEAAAMEATLRTFQAALFIERGETGKARVALDQADAAVKAVGGHFRARPMADLFRELLQRGVDASKTP